MRWADILSLAIIVLVLGSIVALLGIVLIRWIRESLRSRRQGDALHCAKCDYDLTGSSGSVCPERGQSFDSDTCIAGEPGRDWPKIVAAAVCLFFVVILVALLLLKIEEIFRLKGIERIG